jgi:hypothetical protein
MRVAARTAAFCSVVMAAAGQAAAQAPVADVIYIPTPSEVVVAMMEMAHVGKGDVVYDLGSGDGRIVIAAVKDFGAARGVGVEIDPVHVQEARATPGGPASLTVSNSASRICSRRTWRGDGRRLMLLPALNLQLRPKLLAELKPGTRIVSHAFDMGDWAPDEARTFNGRMVYLWTIPR